MAVAAVAERSVYHPRDPTASPLWRCLDVHYDAFRRNYPATFQETHGFFRTVVDAVVEDYLECGDLRNGFARIRCTTPGCGKEMLLAFSCKGRWFCPSCHEKKVLQFGEFAVGEVLYPCPTAKWCSPCRGCSGCTSGTAGSASARCAGAR